MNLVNIYCREKFEELIKHINRKYNMSYTEVNDIIITLNEIRTRHGYIGYIFNTSTIKYRSLNQVIFDLTIITEKGEIRFLGTRSYDFDS